LPAPAVLDGAATFDPLRDGEAASVDGFAGVDFDAVRRASADLSGVVAGCAAAGAAAGVVTEGAVAPDVSADAAVGADGDD